MYPTIYTGNSVSLPAQLPQLPTIYTVNSVSLPAQLHQGGADGNRFKKNRWRTVHVVCEQGGKPDKRSLTGPANAPVKKTTKNTTTKKVLFGSAAVVNGMREWYGANKIAVTLSREVKLTSRPRCAVCVFRPKVHSCVGGFCGTKKLMHRNGNKSCRWIRIAFVFSQCFFRCFRCVELPLSFTARHA